MSGASTLEALTQEERVAGFIKATCSMAGAAARWKKRAESGLTDEALAEALRYELGIFGGSSGPDCLSTSQQGAGLKIWIGRAFQSPAQTKPTFEGKGTIAMARLVYRIGDPADTQLPLF